MRRLPSHLDRKVHGGLTITWFLIAIPAVLWWRHSVPFLVYVSVYANFVGHWSSYQAAKAEENVQEVVGEAVVEGDPEATARFKEGLGHYRAQLGDRQATMPWIFTRSRWPSTYGRPRSGAWCRRNTNA